MTNQTPTITRCPDWCTVDHTGDGPEFHGSVLGIVEAFGEQVSARLFQYDGEDCEPRIVVAGVGMTPGQARAFAGIVTQLAANADTSKVVQA